MSQRHAFCLWKTWGKCEGRDSQSDDRGVGYLHGKARAACEELFGDAVLFTLRAQDTVYGVGSAITRLVIVAYLHFAQQSKGQHIKAAQEQAQGHHHQRAVVGHDRHVTQKLFHGQPHRDSSTTEDAEHAEGAKKMQRTRQVEQQETDGDEVEKYTEGA